MPPLIPSGNSDYANSVMPQTGNDALLKRDLGYTYAGGVNLRPGSELHEMILQEVKLRALEAFRAQQPRHDTMRDMDDLMTAFVPLDARERKSLSNDKRKPVSIVMPVTYAVGQVLQTQCLSLLAAQENLHQYLPSSPEDAIGAMLAELIIAKQSAQFKELAAHAVQIMDSLKYGFGAITPCWERKHGYRTTSVPVTAPDPITGVELPTGEMRPTRMQTLLYEGNNVRNIDPYRFLLDPNVSITRIQDAEYVGYSAVENRLTLLNREKDYPEGWFNARYVEELVGPNKPFTSALFTDAENAGGQGLGGMRSGSTDTKGFTHNRVDCLYMYMTIVPAEWKDSNGRKLGNKTVPEKWLFGIAGDRILIAAQPLDLDHDMYPICVMAPEADGYGCSPMALLEITRGVQTAIDFEWNSHMAEVKRFLKGRFMGDASRVNVRDVVKGAEFIRVNRLAFGTRLNDVLQQVPVSAVTAGNITDMGLLDDYIERATGASQNLQGIYSKGERKSATEAQGVMRSALGRVEKMVLLAGVQSHQDLSYMMLSQTSQFMSKETYVRMAGRWETELMEEFGKQSQSNGWATDNRGMFPVRPGDLDVFADVVPLNPTKSGEDSFETWVQLYGMVQQNPAVMQAWDSIRMLKHIARLGGARNASDFALQDGRFVAQVVSDQQALEMASSGNAAPIEQMAAPAGQSGGQPLDQ